MFLGLLGFVMCTIIMYRNFLDRNNLLLYAAVNGKVELAKFLVAAGTDVDHVFQNGKTHMHAAAGRGQAQILLLLLANGAHVDDERFSNHSSPLREAVKNCKFKCAKLLLAAGADVKKKYPPHGMTVLHDGAALAGGSSDSKITAQFAELLETMIEYGADVEAKDNNGNAPFDLAWNAAMKQIWSEWPQIRSTYRGKVWNIIRVFLDAGSHFPTKLQQVHTIPLFLNVFSLSVSEFLERNKGNISNYDDYLRGGIREYLKELFRKEPYLTSAYISVNMIIGPGVDNIAEKVEVYKKYGVYALYKILSVYYPFWAFNMKTLNQSRKEAHEFENVGNIHYYTNRGKELAYNNYLTIYSEWYSGTFLDTMNWDIMHDLLDNFKGTFNKTKALARIFTLILDMNMDCHSSQKKIKICREIFDEYITSYTRDLGQSMGYGTLGN